MIDRLPRCLHTCLNCTNAVICEKYSGPSRKIIFEGCWKMHGVTTPKDRGSCDRFEESFNRTKRSFWKKWEGCIFVAGGYGQEDKRYDSFENADDFLDEKSSTEVQNNHDSTPGSAAVNEDHVKELPTLRNILTIDELPIIGKSPRVAITEGSEKVITREGETPGTKYQKHNGRNKISDVTDIWKGKGNTTRSLILKALSYSISRLSDIADFADVNPSTAHYHLRNLMRDGRVQKLSRGSYAFTDDSKNESHFFDTFLKNESQLQREVSGEIQLHPYEKNILMEILTKDNKYEQYSGRKLAIKCGMSRNTIHKYTLKLEKKKLIKIEKVGKQYIYTPTKVAIYGLSDFFTSLKTGSKMDSSSSKSEPIREPVSELSRNEKIRSTDEVRVDPGIDGVQGDPVTEVQADPGESGTDTDDVQLDPETEIEIDTDEPNESIQKNIFETFEDSINFQQKNAHRFIIQFKLLRCSHARLKGTGWIFGKKSIHQHFTEAYVFKSKDPSREIINVLPKDPFIFTSEFDFNTKVIDFVNEVIVRLRDYGIVIDLSEPAEIRMQHEAVEDDVFARKLIKRGLLHFRCKVKTIDSTGEFMEYVVGIDKSKKLHFEIEGREAHVLTANFEAFVDDVISGRIDRKVLREMPQRLDTIEDWIQREFGEIEETLERNIEGIQDTQKLLHRNQLEFSQNLISHVEMVQKIGEAALSVKQAADTVKDMTEALYDVMRKTTRPLWDHTQAHTREMEVA
ncbi:MAG: winged helix-turn-helix transcriptional regulator [Theionarchaea archaeon]|nr:winged helix-turn-helix transcriptional regulator [Theionarchaea archaeon]